MLQLRAIWGAVPRHADASGTKNLIQGVDGHRLENNPYTKPLLQSFFFFGPLDIGDNISQIDCYSVSTPATGTRRRMPLIIAAGRQREAR